MKKPAYRHVVLYDPEARIDRDAAAASGKEGSNDYRPPTVSASDEESYAASIPSQGLALKLVEDLHATFCSLFPEERHAAEHHAEAR